jgi:hypothetical protein
MPDSLMKGEVFMMKLRTVRVTIMTVLIAGAITLIPLLAASQEYKTFKSEEFGFSIKYPASWIKIDNPKGSYYVIFQAPDKVKNFRSRIHVAAHKPVKDPLKVFLQEMRNGIKDLQKTAKSAGRSKQDVRIIDEGKFRCDVGDAHYFFIQALEEKLKLWMGIVIVFYKHDNTLLRVSCLAPFEKMEQYHKMFNDVLTSVKFFPVGAAAGPSKPSAVAPPSPGAPSTRTPPPAASKPTVKAPPAAPTPGRPAAPSQRTAPAPAPALPKSAPAPTSVPRGPTGRGPQAPPTGAGIVE